MNRLIDAVPAILRREVLSNTALADLLMEEKPLCFRPLAGSRLGVISTRHTTGARPRMSTSDSSGLNTNVRPITVGNYSSRRRRTRLPATHLPEADYVLHYHRHRD
jgi:hypothetical protein